MNKYDDIFNRYFFNYNFKSEEEKESSRLLFNQLMDELNNTEYYFSNPNSSLTESLGKDLPNLHTTDDVDNLIKEHNLRLVDIKINSKKMVIESWVSKEEGYSMSVTYVLSKESFSKKDQNSKNMIIESLYENELDVTEYLDMLPIDQQLNYYNTMMEECVEIENYEKAAEFRDIINYLNSEL